MSNISTDKLDDLPVLLGYTTAATLLATGVFLGTIYTSTTLATVLADTASSITATPSLDTLTALTTVGVVTGIGVIAMILLADTGRYGFSTVFAEKLPLPNGHAITGGAGLAATIVLTLLWISIPAVNALPGMTNLTNTFDTNALSRNFAGMLSIISLGYGYTTYVKDMGMYSPSSPQPDKFTSDTESDPDQEKQITEDSSQATTHSQTEDTGPENRTTTTEMDTSSSPSTVKSQAETHSMLAPTQTEDEQPSDTAGSAMTNETSALEWVRQQTAQITTDDQPVHPDENTGLSRGEEPPKPAANPKPWMTGNSESDDTAGGNTAAKSADQTSAGETPAADNDIDGLDANDVTDPDGDETSDDLEYDWVMETDVSMADVGGMEEVKDQLDRDIVKPLEADPETIEKMGIPLPNLLLHGPPGTGKTFIAKALATELGLPFVNLSGSDVTSKWLNESGDLIKSLFEDAVTMADAEGGAVVFLDELDAVLMEREEIRHEENRKVVNEFLTHLQNTQGENVLFIGATNKFDDLDDAAVRSGRFDKKVFVGEPDEEARAKIFKAQLTGRPHTISDEQFEEFANRTEGLVAADVEAIVEQAARNALFERGVEKIEWVDVEEALTDF